MKPAETTFVAVPLSKMIFHEWGNCQNKSLVAGAVAAQPATNFISIVQKNFLHWDLNHDGILSSNELDVAVADVQTTNENTAAVATFKRASRGTKTPPPVLTLEKIQTATEKRQPDFSQMFREGLKRIAGATNRMLLTEGLPKLETIHQGKLDNFLSRAGERQMRHRRDGQGGDRVEGGVAIQDEHLVRPRGGESASGELTDTARRAGALVSKCHHGSALQHGLIRGRQINCQAVHGADAKRALLRLPSLEKFAERAANKRIAIVQPCRIRRGKNHRHRTTKLKRLGDGRGSELAVV